MAKMKVLKREQNGNGSIVKLKGGAFQFWYNDPKDGKRKAIRLKVTDKETGKLRNCKDKEEAEEARSTFMAQIRALDSIKTTEQAQTEIIKTRKLVASMEHTPAELWQVYLDSPTRPQSITQERLNDEQRITEKFVSWCSGHGIKTFCDVSHEQIQNFLNAIEKDLSARSYNAYRGMLKTVFQHTYRQLGMNENPVAETSQRRVVTQSRKEFTESQVKAIFSGFDTGFFYDSVEGGPTPKDGERKTKRIQYHPEDEDEFRIVMLLGAFAGARLIDACLMKWANIDMDRREITYTPHKTAHSSGRVVRVPMHPTLFSALAGIYDARESEFVTPNLARRYSYNVYGISKTIQKLIQCATGLDITAEKSDGRARGASQYGMHSFRHTFVSFCANAGVPLAVVADIVGHGNPAMTEHYYHANSEAKNNAIGMLPTLAADETKDELARLRKELDGILDGADAQTLAKVIEFARETTGGKQLPQ